MNNQSCHVKCESLGLSQINPCETLIEDRLLLRYVSHIPTVRLNQARTEDKILDRAKSQA